MAMLIRAAATLVLALAAAHTAAVAFYISGGPCPAPAATALDSIDITRFLGRWYEVQRYIDVSEPPCKCTVVDYAQDEAGKVTLETNTTALYGKDFTNTGSVVVSTDGNAALDITYDIQLFGVKTLNFTVLDTDYDSYAVLYACSDISGRVSFETARIYGREKTLDEDATTKVQEVITQAGLSSSLLRDTPQTC